MRFSVEKPVFEEAIQTCARAVNAKSPLPVLSHILVEAHGNTVRLTATDLDFGIELEVAAEVLEEGSRALPARLLSDIVSRLPAAPVTVETDEARIRIRCGRSKFEVASIDGSEFPSIPVAENAAEFAFPQREFRAMVKKVGTACATSDESRAVMTGILTQVEGGTLRMVATDGRRMGLAEFTTPDDALAAALGGGREALSVIVPGKAMQEVARISADSEEPLRLLLSSNMMHCTVRNVSMHCRLLEGSFPDYKRVLPTEFQRCLRMGRDALLAGLKRMLIVAQERQSPNLIVLDLADGTLDLSANTPDLGLGAEEIPVIYEGAPLRIAFNGLYMQQVLSVLECDEVQVQLQDDTRSAVLRPWGDEGFRYVLMPVRLREAVVEEAPEGVAA